MTSRTIANSWQLAFRLLSIPTLLAAAAPVAGLAQSGAPAPTANPPGTSAPIGRTRAQEVQVTGDVQLRNGEMQLGNGSTITAGTSTIPITLTRGGDLRLCATTSVHLARDRSIQAPDASGLLLALDRGAIEAHYTTSKYSDVLLTPDLRILISGPGVADVSVRVSRQGDTCIDNRGPNAPYIIVSSQLEDGVYRVQPGQHVSFLHGSLHEVVDTEKEPCGCPAPPVSVADAGTPGTHAAPPGAAVAAHPAAGALAGGPAAAQADTEFPLAVSEGLLTPPTIEPTAPVAAPGEAHLQVAVPFSYNAKAAANTETEPAGDLPPIPAPSPAAPAPVPENFHNLSVPPPPPIAPPAPNPVPATPATVIAQPPPPRPTTAEKPRNFFRRVGHFFAKVFGAEPQS
jgi:hypothetical protein